VRVFHCSVLRVRVIGLLRRILWATGFYSSAESCKYGMRGRATQWVRLFMLAKLPSSFPFY
jgi:hypothetical protein